MACQFMYIHKVIYLNTFQPLGSHPPLAAQWSATSNCAFTTIPAIALAGGLAWRELACNHRQAFGSPAVIAHWPIGQRFARGCSQ